jgi:uncharacterized MAPEG superfamily protein
MNKGRGDQSVELKCESFWRREGDFMSELVCLELGVLLWVVHVVVQAVFALPALGNDYLTSARDEKPAAQGVSYPRATRALANYVENFAPFAATDLGLIVTNHTGGWGATIWILARVVYIPLYVRGVPQFRTAAWVVSIIGLLMMLGRLAF